MIRGCHTERIIGQTTIQCADIHEYIQLFKDFFLPLFSIFLSNFQPLIRIIKRFNQFFGV